MIYKEITDTLGKMIARTLPPPPLPRGWKLDRYVEAVTGPNPGEIVALIRHEKTGCEAIGREVEPGHWLYTTAIPDRRSGK